MRNWGKLILLVSLVALTAASCTRGKNPNVVQTSIDQAAVATGIDFENKAENQVDAVAAGTPSIYLSARVVNPQKKTRVQVRWYKGNSEVVATEDFTGGQKGDSQFDYDATVSSSYFASQVDRPGTSWPIGDYKAEIWLDGKLYQTLPFKVVSDQDVAQLRAQNMIKKVTLGDKVDAENNLLTTATTFKADTSHIYASVDLNKVAVGSNLEVAVRYLKENISATSYKLKYQSGDNLTIELDGEQVFRKSHPNRVWPTGSYELTVKIDGVLAKTTAFVIS